MNDVKKMQAQTARVIQQGLGATSGLTPQAQALLAAAAREYASASGLDPVLAEDIRAAAGPSPTPTAAPAVQRQAPAAPSTGAAQFPMRPPVDRNVADYTADMASALGPLGIDLKRSAPPLSLSQTHGLCDALMAQQQAQGNPFYALNFVSDLLKRRGELDVELNSGGGAWNPVMQMLGTLNRQGTLGASQDPAFAQLAFHTQLLGEKIVRHFKPDESKLRTQAMNAYNQAVHSAEAPKAPVQGASLNPAPKAASTVEGGDAVTFRPKGPSLAKGLSPQEQEAARNAMTYAQREDALRLLLGDLLKVQDVEGHMGQVQRRVSVPHDLRMDGKAPSGHALDVGTMFDRLAKAQKVVFRENGQQRQVRFDAVKQEWLDLRA